MRRVVAVIERARRQWHDLRCFAHIAVRTAGRQRDCLLGWDTRVEPGVTLLDHRTAPLAEVFFAHEEGEPYELDHDGRAIEGTLVERHLLHFDARGVLCAVELPARAYAIAEDGAITLDPSRAPIALVPRSAEACARVATVVDVPLDEAQRRAVSLPVGRALRVGGEAGAGKTTVLLHRLAWLHRELAEREGRTLRALLVAPSEGLRRLLEHSAARLGIEGAEAVLYDRWAARIARRAFRGLPTRTERDAEIAVLRVKRHRALIGELERMAERQASVLDEDALHTRGARRGRVERADLLQLFGDHDALERVTSASDGALSQSDVRSVLAHTRAQFRERTEDTFADVVDATRLDALDGRSLDAGTPDDAASRMDTEDFAVLFELDRLRARARGEPEPALPERYDVVIVDEAQELAPLELRLVGRALAPGGTLVIAGDAGQAVDETACFDGWARAMDDLGASEHGTVHLETSYRCPPEITQLARHVLDPRAPAPPPSPRIVHLRVPSEAHALVRIADALRAIADDDPRATSAVIARTAETARRHASVLTKTLDVRASLDDFELAARHHVTHVAAVRGLELDWVFVPDASAATYPDEAHARRALYVAITRASHQLVLLSVGPPTDAIRE